MRKEFFLIPILGILLCTGACKVDKQKDSNESLLNEKRKWMNEYALCTCVALLNKQDTTLQNDISRSVYVEITDYNRVSDRNIYKAVDSLAYKAVSSITPNQIADYEGRKPYMKSCIEFSQSKSLDSLIHSYDLELQLNPE